MDAVSNATNSSFRFGKFIPVRATGLKPAFVTHVVPLSGGGLDVFTAALSIVFITSMVLDTGPAPSLLQVLCDLTPGEARTARQITEGGSIEQISLATGVSQNTIKTRL